MTVACPHTIAPEDGASNARLQIHPYRIDAHVHRTCFHRMQCIGGAGGYRNFETCVKTHEGTYHKGPLHSGTSQIGRDKGTSEYDTHRKENPKRDTKGNAKGTREKEVQEKNAKSDSAAKVRGRQKSASNGSFDILRDERSVTNVSADQRFCSFGENRFIHANGMLHHGMSSIKGVSGFIVDYF
ncbi:hypothetical protein JB92DRAFT_3109376 [Gautieria morchelliformis]|nr:hypothetical protein JB92DRAFT_3109376 [Gautieria morchelliformis]